MGILTSNDARPTCILRLRVLCGHPVPPQYSLQHAAAIEELRELLAKAKQLRALRIIEKSSYSTGASGWGYFQGLDCIKSDVFRCLHLTEFEYRGRSIRDPRLWELLSLQSSIKRLALQKRGYDDEEDEEGDEDGEEVKSAPPAYEPPLGDTALPKLEAVSAPYRSKLISGRPIRYASVAIDGPDDSAPLWADLSASSCQITALSVTVALDKHDLLDPFIALLSHNLTQLRYLSCKWSDDKEPNSLNVTALNSLRSLAALEFIRWEYGFWPSRDDPTYDPQRTNPSGYAGASLRHVWCDVRTTMTGLGGITYRAYWDLAEGQARWKLDFYKKINPPAITAFPVDELLVSLRCPAHGRRSLNPVS